MDRKENISAALIIRNYNLKVWEKDFGKTTAAQISVNEDQFVRNLALDALKVHRSAENSLNQKVQWSI